MPVRRQVPDAMPSVVAEQTYPSGQAVRGLQGPSAMPAAMQTPVVAVDEQVRPVSQRGSLVRQREPATLPRARQ